MAASFTVAHPGRRSGSRFWRDPAVPFIKAREVQDGRHFSHAAHSHESFSIGAVTAGQSRYVNGALRCTVSHGNLVLMNPGAVHACNPLQDQRWAYFMLYVDTTLARTLPTTARPSVDAELARRKALPDTAQDRPGAFASKLDAYDEDVHLTRTEGFRTRHSSR